MNEDIRKFDELMKTDENMQKKIDAAIEAYDGEQTGEAIFEKVIAPIAAEYGLHITFEEVKTYLEQLIPIEL